MSSRYIGRFAPSPTGPLHLGSLLTALASYLDAKSKDGLWLVRIEDLDPPREQAGASEEIIQSLAAHGLQHDGDICFQSQRYPRYKEVLETLQTQGSIFPCQCSRQALRHNNGLHQGPCTKESVAIAQAHWAWRARVKDKTIRFFDALQGHQQQDLLSEVGDFVLLRKDGLVAYQLAVVIDDIDFGVNHVVRGSDLLDSTARQIYLYESLNLQAPQYCHLPLIKNQQGQKLSKQNHAPPLDNNRSEANLYKCLQLLGQNPKSNLQQASCQEILAWGVANWQLHKIPRALSHFHI